MIAGPAGREGDWKRVGFDKVAREGAGKDCGLRA